MKMRRSRIFFLIMPLFFAACATQPKHVNRSGEPIPQDHLSEVGRPEIPLVMNDHVQDWINYFQGSGRERFELFLSRSGKYIPMMRRVLREEGMPANLVYLAMIESGFNPHAYSRARATGAWQFIYQTGRRYGLRTDSWIDERRDPEKSTVAAAKYMKDLYDRYNNWYLAAAGYNAGEGKINRAIRKYATEDFWELTRGHYLKSETKNYVPKLIAAALIAKNPEKYGFAHVNYEEPLPFDEVVLSDPMDLRVAARLAGVSYEDIKTLNPELLHWVTPPNYAEYRLKIPAKSVKKFEAALASLGPGETMGEDRVKVVSGTSLTKVARKHGLPVLLLAMANGLSPSERVTSTSLVLPYHPPAGERFVEINYNRPLRGHHRHPKRVVSVSHARVYKRHFAEASLIGNASASPKSRKHQTKLHKKPVMAPVSAPKKSRHGKTRRSPQTALNR